MHEARSASLAAHSDAVSVGDVQRCAKKYLWDKECVFTSSWDEPSVPLVVMQSLTLSVVLTPFSPPSSPPARPLAASPSPPSAAPRDSKTTAGCAPA